MLGFFLILLVEPFLTQSPHFQSKDLLIKSEDSAMKAIKSIPNCQFFKF